MAKKRVLAVDDSELCRTYLETALQSAGYTPITASDGVEALELASQEPPDLVFSDIQMPQMDGYELTERLKQDPKLRHIPVIAVSTTKEVDRLMAAGFDGHLSKPIAASEVHRVVKAYVEAAGVLAGLQDEEDQSPPSSPGS